MLKKIFEIIIAVIFIVILILAMIQRFYIPIKQNYHNNKIINKDSQYKIICLGESTTAGAYPIQLQKILDEKYPDKFSVIDCGNPGQLLASILKSLDNNITKYNPNIAICMIDYMPYQYSSYTPKSKKINKNNSVNKEENNEQLKFALKLRDNGETDNAIKEFKLLLQKNPNNEIAFAELASTYYHMMKEKEIGYNMAIEALNKNFNLKKELYYVIVFQYYVDKKDFKNLKVYINKAINEDIDIFSTQIKYFIYSVIKQHITDEQKDKLVKVMDEDSSNFYGFEAINAIKNKDYQKAKEYFDKAEEIRLHHYDEKNFNLYKSIIRKLIDNNIKVICMQYPLRSVVSLQNILKDETYYDKITFISNEKLFKDALINDGYDKFFKDQTAGDFGHCTDLGNTMIAENVVKTLEDILNLKQN